MRHARPRLIDRIADASVFVPAGLGVVALAGDFAQYGRECGGGSVCAVFVGLSGVLHVWFRAEDRWRHHRLLREARRQRMRVRHATPAACLELPPKCGLLVRARPP